MAIKKVVNELAEAQLIIDRAENGGARKNRKVFLMKLLLGKGKCRKSVFLAVN
jgi:hypothetical protein